ncbi:MAG TPA: LptF/LptG family permease [Nitrospiria bacterium]|nr:LptF/LptG family permease [Nitrospiria bacterium]
MAKIDRYILAELILPFSITLGVFLLFLVMQQGLMFLDWIVNRGVSPSTVLRLFLALLPLMLLLALPVGTLIASTSAFSRLAGDREVLAWFTVGVSPWRLLRPVVLFAGGVALVSTLLLHAGDPISGESMKTTALSMLSQEQAALIINEGQFQPLQNGLILYVEQSDQPGQLNGVFVFDYRNAEQVQFVVAQEGQFHRNPATQRLELTLRHGSLHRRPEPNAPYQRIFFDSYTRGFDVAGLLRSPAAVQSIAEVRREYERGGRTNVSLLDQLVTYHTYHALPIACVLFAILGFPLGLLASRGGRLGGFAAGLAVLLGYYLLMTAATSFAENQRFPYLAAAWLPNGLLLLFTIGAHSRLAPGGLYVSLLVPRGRPPAASS